MATVADDIAEGLADIRTELGVSVTYVRKLTGSRIPLTVVVRGKSGFMTSDQRGQVVLKDARDWLVEVAQLLDSGAFEPDRNDIIEFVNGSFTEHYRVLPFGDNKDADVFEHSDQARTQVRIHSKYTKKVAI